MRVTHTRGESVAHWIAAALPVYRAGRSRAAVAVHGAERYP